MIKRAKINYYMQAFDEVTNKSKHLYRHLKSLLGGKMIVSFQSPSIHPAGQSCVDLMDS